MEDHATAVIPIPAPPGPVPVLREWTVRLFWVTLISVELGAIVTVALFLTWLTGTLG